MDKKTMGVKLDEDIRVRLKKLGEAKQRTTHWLMKEAINRYLVEEERYEQEKTEDETRWRRYLETGEALSHEEVEARLQNLANEAARKARAE